MSDQRIAPVKTAFVRALRANPTLKAGLSNEIHEGVAPRAIDYPFLVYFIAWSVRDYEFGQTQVMRTGIRHWVVSDDQVEAHNLDSLVYEAIQDTSLDMESSGQTVVYCRRTADRSEADEDDAGRKVYQVGGVTEIWTTL